MLLSFNGHKPFNKAAIYLLNLWINQNNKAGTSQILYILVSKLTQRRRNLFTLASIWKWQKIAATRSIKTYIWSVSCVQRHLQGKKGKRNTEKQASNILKGESTWTGGVWVRRRKAQILRFERERNVLTLSPHQHPLLSLTPPLPRQSHTWCVGAAGSRMPRWITTGC